MVKKPPRGCRPSKVLQGHDFLSAAQLTDKFHPLCPLKASQILYIYFWQGLLPKRVTRARGGQGNISSSCPSFIPPQCWHLSGRDKPASAQGGVTWCLGSAAVPGGCAGGKPVCARRMCRWETWLCPQSHLNSLGVPVSSEGKLAPQEGLKRNKYAHTERHKMSACLFVLVPYNKGHMQSLSKHSIWIRQPAAFLNMKRKKICSQNRSEKPYLRKWQP